ncbi:hypothetical protein MANES_05G115333v8 [Manihot esculenta]|uniref:Uncharacterized protein n=1 Tax=Manihot esculenta TaxID=3983 RepID=A0ACB7HTU8_MANES|nr:hypothetical protein MANES_05G115333v8 [Manihot esculenta]
MTKQQTPGATWKKDKEVRWPSKHNPKKAGRRDSMKYYCFHEDHEHAIEECRQLKDEIERLIRDDTLRSSLGKTEKKGDSSLSEPVGVIHVIIGGPNDGKGKNKRVTEDVLSIEQESWTKQEIKFGPADKVIGFFNNDPLVISVCLNWYGWVLVNIGSFVNLITVDVFNKLGDKVVVVLGTINLPLVLGDEKQKRELYEEFVVVDIQLAFNVIFESARN